ncbi:alpha/beta hydrolase [Leisingera sp. JC11]|uniref:alpha/beta fold hydrolase n=1 Tax=Leisingera sp. JC11 TaxID=3042469 RepID=UPI003453A375
MGKGSFFETEPGVELYYEDHGDGPPIVFVPGWTFTTEVFRHQFAHFSKRHRVVSFDPRSQGRSTLVLTGNDYTTQSADLCRLIDHLGLQNPVLVGWSAASLTVWGVVRNRGTAPLRGIVTIDMPPAPLTGRDEDWTEFDMPGAMAFYQALMTPKGHRDIVTWYAREIMVQRGLTEAELDWIVSQSTSTPCWAAAAYCAAAWFSDFLPEAKVVDQALPGLFVVADSSADKALPYLKRHLSNTEVELLGGHFMFWEHPDQFNAILDAFIAKLN